MLPLPDNVIRRAPQEARTISVVGHSTVSGSTSPLASWRISNCAARAPRLRALTATLVSAGKRVLRLLDVVEADDGEILADLDAAAAKRAHQADRDDVVEAQRGGRGRGEAREVAATAEPPPA